MTSLARLMNFRNASFLWGARCYARSLLPNTGIRSSTVRHCATGGCYETRSPLGIIVNLSAKRMYTEKHEWVLIEGQEGTVGISDYAQEALGELVYVQLPEVGSNLKQFAESCVVESVKAASDVYSPVSGTVTEVNKSLEDTPSLVNKSCLEKGWLYKLKLSEPTELEKLLDETKYERLVKKLREDE